jgi:hypothetical protein
MCEIGERYDSKNWDVRRAKMTVTHK